MSLPTSSDGSPPTLFAYTPNQGAAGLFIALFGLGSVAHFVAMCWLQTWYFLPFLLGCIMETFGYYGRFWLHDNPQNYKAYVLYTLLVVPAPIFMAATLYMSIRRIIESLNAEKFSPMRPRWMSKLFVLLDVICFLVQIAGVGMQCTTSASMQRTGGKVVVIGLILQILVFLIFCTLVWRFWMKWKYRAESDCGIHWSSFLAALLIAGGLIILRNIVVGAEHAEGSQGFVAAHEVFAYVFDALPIFVVVCLFLVFHPGRLQRQARRLRPLTMTSGSEPPMKAEDDTHHQKYCNVNGFEAGDDA